MEMADSRICILTVCAAMLASCTQENFVPRDGDLLFCTSGNTAMSQAITTATRTRNHIQYDHVAVYANVDGVPSVIEASAQAGVCVVSWEEFIERADRIDGKPGIDVMRINEDVDIPAAIDKALSFKGQSYDWYYLPENGMMYCSELIYESFLRRDGSHLFTPAPMNFRDKDGNMPEFWEELFAGLGKEVPEGEPGTNPNDMSMEPVLTLVHRYFD